MNVPLLHERWRQRVSLLAMGALAEDERRAVEEHLEGCAACCDELSSLQRMIARIPADEVGDLPLATLVAGVRRRLALAEARPTPARAWNWKLAALPIAAAALLAAYVVLPRLESMRPKPTAQVEAPASPGRPLSEDSLRRLERNLSREHAARYLSEAQDVLVTVADALPRCRRAGHVDVGDEARRSRELLETRALLVGDTEALAGVRPVLDDVDNVLRELAVLDDCARRADIEAISAILERRRLLMKMDLMARELAG